MAETKNPEDKSAARNIHLSSLLTYLLAVLPVFTGWTGALAAGIVPLISWINNRKNEYVSTQAAEGLFFQGVLAALLFAVTWSFPASIPLQVLGFGVVGFFHLASLITATISTSYGKDFHHLFSPLRMFKKRRDAAKAEKEILANVDSATKEMYLSVMKNSTEKTLQIANLAAQISDTAVKNKTGAIILSLQKILENFKKDPEDVMNSRHFLSYSLDSLVKILSKYIELTKSESSKKQFEATLEKVLPTLDSIHTAIDGHYNKLLENDVMELDAEIQVMEKTIQMGGF